MSIQFISLSYGYYSQKVLGHPSVSRAVYDLTLENKIEVKSSAWSRSGFPSFQDLWEFGMADWLIPLSGKRALADTEPPISMPLCPGSCHMPTNDAPKGTSI